MRLNISNHIILFVLLSVLFSLIFTSCHSYKPLKTGEVNDPAIRNKIAKLKQGLQQNPEDKNLNLRLGELYLTIKDYQSSDHYISEAIKIDTNYYDAFYLRAELYSNLVTDCSREKPNSSITFEEKLFFRLIYENYKISSQAGHLRDHAIQEMKKIWPLADCSGAHIWWNSKRKIEFFNPCYKWIKPEIKSKNLAYYLRELKDSN